MIKILSGEGGGGGDSDIAIFIFYAIFLSQKMAAILEYQSAKNQIGIMQGSSLRFSQFHILLFLVIEVILIGLFLFNFKQLNTRIILTQI